MKSNLRIIINLIFMASLGCYSISSIISNIKQEKLMYKEKNVSWKNKGYQCIENKLFFLDKNQNFVSLDKKCNFNGI